MRQTLWTKNFTIITLGTVISAIGGVAMSFALGFVVFDTTGSTLATALFTAVSALPRVLLPVLLSPYLDNFRRKPVIVERSVFQLAAGNSRLPCPCGQSAVEVTLLGDKVRLTVPCLFCEQEHTVTCSTAATVRVSAPPR